MDNFDDKKANPDKPQKPENQDDSANLEINKQAHPPLWVEQDNQASARADRSKPVEKPKRPKIPLISEEHFEEFDYAPYMEKKGQWFGKWFIGLIIVGVLVWMIPGSFDIGEEITKEEPDSAQIPAEKRDIQLFLADTSLLGLIPTEMSMALGGTIEEKIHSVLETLFVENQRLSGLFPEEMIVRDVFVHNGEAIVSLDSGFRKKFMGGAWSELLAVYSIVNSASDNFGQIKAVRILIDDQETRFFVSHVSVAEPLKPKSSLVILAETPE